VEFQRGQIRDYYMLPAGRLALDFKPSRMPRGFAGPAPVRRARVTAGHRALGRSALRDHFHALERIAGVTPVPGREW
jgi:hypothetical protein